MTSQSMSPNPNPTSKRSPTNTTDTPNSEAQDATNLSDIDAGDQAQGGRGKPTSALQSVPSGGPGFDRKRRLGPVQNPTLNKVRKEDKDSSLKIRIELDVSGALCAWKVDVVGD